MTYTVISVFASKLYIYNLFAKTEGDLRVSFYGRFPVEGSKRSHTSLFIKVAGIARRSPSVFASKLYTVYNLLAKTEGNHHQTEGIKECFTIR